MVELSWHTCLYDNRLSQMLWKSDRYIGKLNFCQRKLYQFSEELQAVLGKNFNKLY